MEREKKRHTHVSTRLNSLSVRTIYICILFEHFNWPKWCFMEKKNIRKSIKANFFQIDIMERNRNHIIVNTHTIAVIAALQLYLNVAVIDWFLCIKNEYKSITTCNIHPFVSVSFGHNGILFVILCLYKTLFIQSFDSHCRRRCHLS